MCKKLWIDFIQIVNMFRPVSLTFALQYPVMARLQDDLLQEFREEQRFVNEQIKLFDPLATSLRKPVAQRLLNKGLLIFMEIVCYLAFLGSIAVGIFLNKLYPFYLVAQLSRSQYREQLGSTNVQNFTIGVYALIALIALLFLVCARMLRRIRLKNAILNIAGKNIKTAVGDLLKRKAAIDAIEQRNFMELPATGAVTSSVELPPAKVNDMPNPGYDGQS